MLTHYGIGFSHFCPLGNNSLLALEGGQRIVKIDLAKSQAEVLGEPPKGRRPSTGFDDATSVYPAGPGCRDGVYCIRDFSLFFKPPKEDWHTVIEHVNIIKTFGGFAVHLPVAYVGQGRFAVAKTTKDAVEQPEEKKGDFDGTPGLAATMLIDGRTGRILKQTAPRLYGNNPPLDVPDDWWSADVKPRRGAWSDQKGNRISNSLTATRRYATRATRRYCWPRRMCSPSPTMAAIWSSIPGFVRARRLLPN